MPDVDNLVIACAGVGSRLGLGLPKALIPLNGQTLIHRLLRATRAVPNIRVVVGFQEEAVTAAVFRTRPDAVVVRNPAFLTTSTLTSFARGADGLVGKTLFMDGDLVVEAAEFERFRARAAASPALFGHCAVASDDPVYVHLGSEGGQIAQFSRTAASDREWASVFCGDAAALFGSRPLADQRSGSVFEWLSAGLPLAAEPIDVREIDTPQDLERVRRSLLDVRRGRGAMAPIRPSRNTPASVAVAVTGSSGAEPPTPPGL